MTSVNKRDHYLILKYHFNNKSVKKIINDNWHLLGTSDTTRSLHETRVVHGSRRNKTLRDHLVSSSIPLEGLTGKHKFGLQGKHSHECPTNDCVYCDSLDTTGKIISHSTSKTHWTKTNVTCRSHNIVYCLQCTTCGKQYVGQTKRTFRERLYEHFRNIRNANNDDPIGRHFTDLHHTGEVKQVKTFILAFITPPSHTADATQLRLRVENEWIYRLRSSLPLGLNSMD